MKTMNPDGSWPDVNYQNLEQGNWLTMVHLSRLARIARTYRRGGPPLEGDPKLAETFHRGLNYWLSHDFQSTNSWYNEIGVPMTMGTIAILMRNELTPEERNLVIHRIMARAQIRYTAENLIWMATGVLERGLLLGDRDLIQKAANAITGEMGVTTKEGIQPDLSYHLHGPQQQFGNYGLAFADSAAMWLKVFQGTPYAFPPDKIGVLRRYLLDGTSWILWRGEMDLSACGRQIGPQMTKHKGAHLLQVMTKMADLDSSVRPSYEACIRRNQPDGANDLVGNRFFWRSDFMVHRRPEFYASVKMCSRRVVGSESFNAENLSGYHLADGATYIQRSGREYDEIQPLWDWQRLPGVTCVQRAEGVPKFEHYRMDSDFVGGVSDGAAGCVVMDINRDGLRAHKAWFFAGDMLACLGSGITGGDGRPVVTTINQCFLNGRVMAGQGRKASERPRGEHALNRSTWAWHDGIGYLFPQRGPITLRSEAREGSWQKVDGKSSVPKEPVHGDIFMLTFEHGTRPQDAGYAYVILPGVQAESMAALARKPDIEILANTTKLQAVRIAREGLSMAIFHEAGALTMAKGVKLAVDMPCVVMLRRINNEITLTAADPTQKLDVLTFRVNGKALALTLPRGGDAGRGTSCIIEKY